mmetsp:Transcript_18998/g.35278  ORF Transcript_18998/g.35278 Transcript_18998/m.35278 type:complete len:190 (+) Transcript_18998:191-760(+)
MSNLINYDGITPSIPHSGETTDFEDALIKHDVIDKRQALGNKGMTEEQINSVLSLDASNLSPDATNYHTDLPSNSGSEFSDEDDDFIASYRSRRLAELEESSAEKARKNLNRFNGVDEISRDEWASAVNGVSEDGTWVVVNLEVRANIYVMVKGEERKESEEAGVIISIILTFRTRPRFFFSLSLSPTA